MITNFSLPGDCENCKASYSQCIRYLGEHGACCGMCRYKETHKGMIKYKERQRNLNNGKELNKTQQAICELCDEIKAILLEKNRKYGDSALNPVRVFSRADASEQLKVRIDDKLSRIKQGEVDEDEDVLLDFIGYLVLLMIGKRRAV